MLNFSYILHYFSLNYLAIFVILNVLNIAYSYSVYLLLLYTFYLLYGGREVVFLYISLCRVPNRSVYTYIFLTLLYSVQKYAFILCNCEHTKIFSHAKSIVIILLRNQSGENVNAKKYDTVRCDLFKINYLLNFLIGNMGY